MEVTCTKVSLGGEKRDGSERREGGTVESKALRHRKQQLKAGVWHAGPMGNRGVVGKGDVQGKVGDPLP